MKNDCLEVNKTDSQESVQTIQPIEKLNISLQSVSSKSHLSLQQTFQQLQKSVSKKQPKILKQVTSRNIDPKSAVGVYSSLTNRKKDQPAQIQSLKISKILADSRKQKIRGFSSDLFHDSEASSRSKSVLKKSLASPDSPYNQQSALPKIKQSTFKMEMSLNISN